MKKLLLVAVVAFASMTAVYAQPGQMPKKTVEERTKMVMDKLADFKLDAAKTASAQAVFTDFFKAQDELRGKMKDGQGDRKAAFETMKKNAEDRDAKLKAIFTEEQYKKWQEMQEEMKSKQRGGRKPGRK